MCSEMVVTVKISVGHNQQLLQTSQEPRAKSSFVNNRKAIVLQNKEAPCKKIWTLLEPRQPDAREHTLSTLHSASVLEVSKREDVL